MGENETKDLKLGIFQLFWILKNSDFFTKGIYAEDNFGYYDKAPMMSKNQMRATMP